MTTSAWGPRPYPLFSVAPMLDVTDRHYRTFLRLISQETLLYSEMVTTGALLHGHHPSRFLDYSAAEHPLALQLGGSQPSALAECARMAEAWGYDEVNLNVGCPSDRVQNNAIGACLMAQPAVVAQCIDAMQAATQLPVTVKCRIGIDDQDEDADLTRFVQQVSEAGCQIFILHARKAWLKGLSPKENREIPPLNYERVYRLKQAFPHLVIGLNGGLTDLDQCEQALKQVDSVMLGRAIWNNPYLLAEVDRRFFAHTRPPLSRHQVVKRYLPYVESRLSTGDRLAHLTRPLMNLFQAMPGARRFRRLLSEQAHRPGQDARLIEQALALVADPSDSVTLEPFS